MKKSTYFRKLTKSEIEHLVDTAYELRDECEVCDKINSKFPSPLDKFITSGKNG